MMVLGGAEEQNAFCGAREAAAGQNYRRYKSMVLFDLFITQANLYSLTK